MKKQMKKEKRKREENNYTKKIAILVIFIIVIVLMLSVAYTALSSTLKINTEKVSQAQITWSVGFVEGEVSPLQYGTSNVGRSCSNAVATSDTVSIGPTVLSKPGDACAYKLTIMNTGSVDAKLSTITPVNPTTTSCIKTGSTMECGNITYMLATDPIGNELLTSNTYIPKIDGSLDVYFILKYTGSGTNVSTSQVGGGYTLVYRQA